MSQQRADLQQPTVVSTRGLSEWVRAFLRSCRAKGLAVSTVERAYAPVLATFVAHCGRSGVAAIEAIDPDLVREYLLSIAAGHAPSTVHRHFRVVRTLLLWYEAEDAPDGWRNPIRRVKAPRVPDAVLDPAPLATLSAYIDRAPPRDRAVLLTLLDTGLRASELLALRTEDFDDIESVLLVRHGKGGKVRTAPLGSRSRRAIRAWLRARGEHDSYLFNARDGGRMTYWGLRDVLARLETRTGIKAPTLHSIRRAFALEMLRGGADLLTVARLLGHADLSQVPKYLKQLASDLRAAHAKASPGDRL